MIALFKALMWLYNTYYRKLQKISKTKKLHFLVNFDLKLKKRPSSKKIQNRIIYPSTFASFFNQISGVGSPKLDFIKII